MLTQFMLSVLFLIQHCDHFIGLYSLMQKRQLTRFCHRHHQPQWPLLPTHFRHPSVQGSVLNPVKDSTSSSSLHWCLLLSPEVLSNSFPRFLSRKEVLSISCLLPFLLCGPIDISSSALQFSGQAEFTIFSSKHST